MDPRPALWHQLGKTHTADDPLSAEVRLLVEYEKLAHRIDTFEPLLIPGLLQTRAYAEIALGLYVAPPALEPQVTARLARQSLLERADAPLMRFLIDEAALHRWAGAAGSGPEIMREQVGRVLRVARNPRVDVRIVPFRAGLHEGVKGPLVILEFDDPRVADLLYLEDEKGDVLRSGAEAVQPYSARFARLMELAVPAERFLRR